MTEPRQFKNVPLRGRLIENEPMAKHVSWRAGGPAARAYQPADLDDLRAFVRATPPHEALCLVGLGSNLLVRDGGFKGTVVFTHGVFDEIQLIEQNGETLIDAQAGVPAPKVARFAARHDLVGAEFMAGIPGTVGGALAMNAGCYGSETWQIVQSVTTLDRAGIFHRRGTADFEIGYRHVVLRPEQKEMPADVVVTNGEQVSVGDSFDPTDAFFISARFRLSKGDGGASLSTIKDFLCRRIASQPLGQPNAGSVFRNPPADHAARLIEASGLKGFQVGGAQVSMKHANFIVNLGGATAEDIEAVIEHVHGVVSARYGIELVREVRIIGDAPLPSSKSRSKKESAQ